MVDILEKMLDPSVYDEPTKQVTVIQTHISWVFMTGKYAYKIKKPVNFGFLDFTTLEKRKFFCEKELKINRRLAPDMYMEVVPINDSGGEIKIKGAGETIEYAVKMKEIPQKFMMLRMLENGTLTNRTIERISKIVA